MRALLGKGHAKVGEGKMKWGFQVLETVPPPLQRVFGVPCSGILAVATDYIHEDHTP